MKKCIATITFCCIAAFAAAAPRTLRISAGAVKTLDPILADDVASRNFTASVYDTLLQYDYTVRPYRLIPSMLSKMPEHTPDFKRYDFELRDDLCFAEDPALPPEARKITARDVKYSILRLADARNHSPLYWMLRGKIAGIDEFNRKSANLQRGDNRIYDESVAGIKIKDDRRFSIELTSPDPRFLYILAMPNAAIVSRQAVEYYQDGIARHPVGSGPFKVKEWITNYKLVLERNPDYRREFFAQAANPADRQRPLPLCDNIEVYLVQQPMSAWLLFLQGKLDCNELDKDNSDLLSGGNLPPALEKRGIKAIRIPAFEIRYVGFNFKDPLLGKNLHLRRALSLAYDIGRRVEYSGFQLLPAHGPLPPGVAGYDESFKNPWMGKNPDAAQKELAAAGFANGIDPSTGEKLQFSFDQSGNQTIHRQYGELAAADFGQFGIRLNPVLNNKPRFYEKLRQGKFQLFRLSWVGDYPDAENFLQLFYSKNSGTCNRTGFSDPEFDRLFEKIMPMPDSPERTANYRRMVEIITEKCAWIFEGFPVAYMLTHQWLENYLPHDFAFGRLKYLSFDPEKRQNATANFRPLSFNELRKH